MVITIIITVRAGRGADRVPRPVPQGVGVVSAARLHGRRPRRRQQRHGVDAARLCLVAVEPRQALEQPPQEARRVPRLVAALLQRRDEGVRGGLAAAAKDLAVSNNNHEIYYNIIYA